MRRWRNRKWKKKILVLLQDHSNSDWDHGSCMDKDLKQQVNRLCLAKGKVFITVYWPCWPLAATRVFVPDLRPDCIDVSTLLCFSGKLAACREYSMLASNIGAVLALGSRPRQFDQLGSLFPQLWKCLPLPASSYSTWRRWLDSHGESRPLVIIA